jgi:hypothetical protein
MCAMADEDPDSFEEKLRAFAREFSESVERAAQQVDLDAIADQIALGGERVRELAESAGKWLSGTPGEPVRRPRLGGPHPLDVPSEAQALALSALASGRWRVAPGTNEIVAEGEGPAPESPEEIVGDLRARDWIAASGEVTPLGHEALKRWSDAGGGAG